MTEIKVVDAICGIYKITNKLNGKAYVGSSKDIHKRWDKHKKDLKGKRHHNAKLQRAWNKGDIELEFSILEECSQDILFDREQHWMDTLDTYSSGYNCSEKAAYPTEKIKTSIKVKYENEFNQINESLLYFKELSDEFPKDVVVSFFGLGAGNGSSDTAFIRRFLKAVNLSSTIILTEASKVDASTEYRLHHIHYSGKEADYVLSPEYNQSKNAKHSIHSKKKKPDLHSQLWEDLMDTLECGKMGKQIKKNYLKYLEDVGIETESC